MPNIGGDSRCEATVFLITAGGDGSGRRSASGLNVFSSLHFTLCEHLWRALQPWLYGRSNAKLATLLQWNWTDAGDAIQRWRLSFTSYLKEQIGNFRIRVRAVRMAVLVRGPVLLVAAGPVESAYLNCPRPPCCWSQGWCTWKEQSMLTASRLSLRGETRDTQSQQQGSGSNVFIVFIDYSLGSALA